MPINITMKPGFLYLGSTQAEAEDPSQAFCVPYATEMPFSTQYRAQLQTSANGEVVGQQIGRALVTQSARWERYDSNAWWSLNQWIASQGMCFFCHYFDFNQGSWMTKEFIVTDISCEPVRPGGVSGALANRGMPTYYANCSLTLTDMGG